MSVRSRLLGAGVLALAAVLVGAFALTRVLGFSPAYAANAAAVWVGWLSLLLVIVRDHPYPTLGPANRITIARASVLALVAGLVLEHASTTVAWVGVVGGTIIALLDGADGRAARKSGMSSAFGARFDMETDALMIFVLSLLVWEHGKAGAWVIAGGLLRYLFVVAGWLMAWMRAPLSPTMRGKTVAVAHMVGLLVALGPIIPSPLSDMAAGLTLLLLCWSFAVDTGRLWNGRGSE